jgi:ABC-type Zn uptake system ZnuABC Zn-binding protein ZnuA
MNQKIQKIISEIEKVKGKIATQQARLRELEQQKTELENTEIVGMVRSLEVTPEELATIIQAIRTGNTGSLPVIAETLERQEEMDDEE